MVLAVRSEEVVLHLTLRKIAWAVPVGMPKGDDISSIWLDPDVVTDAVNPVAGV